jgi:hypothetical protein
VRNSDLLCSGSNDGFINFYKFNREEKKLENLKKLGGMQGCINSLKFSYPAGTDFAKILLAATHSKEDRLGRWHVESKAKTGITIIRKQ